MKLRLFWGRNCVNSALLVSIRNSRQPLTIECELEQLWSPIKWSGLILFLLRGEIRGRKGRRERLLGYWSISWENSDYSQYTFSFPAGQKSNYFNFLLNPLKLQEIWSLPCIIVRKFHMKLSNVCMCIFPYTSLEFDFTFHSTLKILKFSTCIYELILYLRK